MKRSIVTTGAALALFATSAIAGTLAPTRPSQVVELRASGSGAVCLPMGGGIDLDLQVNSDGTVSPYVPPAGYALVITGMDWGTQNGPPNEYTPVGIRVAGPHKPAPLVFVTGAQADGTGKTWGSALVPNVTVAPGATPCVGASGGDLNQVVVHGFHTVNK
jgi:hypothetical protein